MVPKILARAAHLCLVLYVCDSPLLDPVNLLGSHGVLVPKLAPVRLAQALLLQFWPVAESMLLKLLVCPVSKVVEAELQRK